MFTLIDESGIVYLMVSVCVTRAGDGVMSLKPFVVCTG